MVADPHSPNLTAGTMREHPWTTTTRFQSHHHSASHSVTIQSCRAKPAIKYPSYGHMLIIPTKHTRSQESLTPQTRWQRQVSCLVVLVTSDRALAIHGQLATQKIGGTRRVLVQLDRDARGGVAVAAGVEETDIAHRPVVLNRMDALTIGSIGTGARARGPWRGRIHRPLFVPHHWVAGLRKRRWNVVLCTRGKSGEQHDMSTKIHNSTQMAH